MRPLKIYSALCVFTYLLFSGLLNTQACLHGPRDANTPVKQSAQEVIILHDGKTEELILSVNYKKGQVSSLAWIIPVPEVPTHYGVVDSRLFRQVHRWVSLTRDVPIPKSRSRNRSSGSKRSSAGVRLLATAQVGPFQIQPIQGVGDAAIPALTQWLTRRGFAEPSRESLAYYVDRNWTFLAIHITPKTSDGQLKRRGALPPLRITFPTSRVVYPLKFSTHMGVFSARVHLFTRSPLPHDAFSGARARGFEVVNRGVYLKTARFSPHSLSVSFSSFRPHNAPRALRPLIIERFGESSRVYLSVLLNERVNEMRVKRFRKTRWRNVQFAPALWREDLSIPALESGERLRGSLLNAKTEPN